MNKTNVTEYADYLLQTAMYKTTNIDEAQDLVQETLMAALVAIEQNKPIDNLKNWLVTVLNRKYYDMLRQKYRKPTVSMDIIADIPVDTSVYENIEKSADAQNVRRCLAYLTKLYREVMVRFYIHGQSVKEIASALNISEGTVKSRLNRGRTHVRKEFDMENFTNNSYEPETLHMSLSGKSGIDGEPFSLVGSDKIAMNILIVAYEKPLTIPEIAKAMGIATAYIEPIVERLINGELMKKVSDRVYTDFIIYKEEDRSATVALERELADKHYEGIWEIVEQGLAELRKQDFYKSQSSSKQVKLEVHFVIRTLLYTNYQVREKVIGKKYNFEQYPDRPNGGKWHAMGHHRVANYDWSKNEHKYTISGESGSEIQNYCGLKTLTMREYDTTLGRTHQGYSNPKYIKHPTNATDVMKMMYAIHTESQEDLAKIDANCFDNIEDFIKLKYLTREDGEVVIDIPVLKMADRWKLYEISWKYVDILSKKFDSEISSLMKNPVEVPAHIKTIPDFQRYMWCTNSFPMMVISNALDNGLFLKDVELPVPAVFLAVEE